jgi:hypothetical protein
MGDDFHYTPIPNKVPAPFYDSQGKLTFWKIHGIRPNAELFISERMPRRLFNAMLKEAMDESRGSERRL